MPNPYFISPKQRVRILAERIRRVQHVNYLTTILEETVDHFGGMGRLMTFWMESLDQEKKLLAEDPHDKLARQFVTDSCLAFVNLVGQRDDYKRQLTELIVQREQQQAEERRRADGGE